MSLNIRQGGINVPVINVDLVVTVAGNGHAANAVKSGDPVLAGNIPGVAEGDIDSVTGLTPVNTNCIAALVVNGTGSAGNARAVLTSDNTNVTAADTVTIGGKVYTFRAALTPAEGEVLIGADADATLTNLSRAINHTGTPGTDYSCTNGNEQVTASAVAAHAITITAKRAGSGETVITTTEASTHLSFDTATLTMRSANAAVNAGDRIYMQSDGSLDKNSGSGVLFGTAFGNDESASAVGTDTRTGQLVASGNTTTTIRVWVGKVN